MDRIPRGTAVLIFAGKSRPMCAGSDYRFLPDRNFFYLTGLEVEDARLILTKADDGLVSVKLFARDRNEAEERWTGKRIPFEELARISGIAPGDVADIGEFDEYLYGLRQTMALAGDKTSITSEAKNLLASSDADVTDISEVLTRMRMVKDSREIECIRQAARITEDALAEMKKLIRPGVTERELFASLEYSMARRGDLIPAFPTIPTIGPNAFYLHHSEPETESGETATPGCQIQIDVGARVHGYCADISRVYFLGTATESSMREKQAVPHNADHRLQLHELICRLRARAWEFIRPGETFDSLNAEMKAITGQWLREQGLLPEGYSDADVKKFYWHGTSHHLGLDTHDASVQGVRFEAGNCLAVEPGVYIPQWGVGFRIEDDILVTATGCELLSSGDDSLEGIWVEPV